MKSKNSTFPCRVGNKAYYVTDDKIYRVKVIGFEDTYSGLCVKLLSSNHEVPELVFYNENSNKLFFSLASLIQSGINVAERIFI